MSDPTYLKCTCQKCGGHIEFPAASAGQTVACPHCNASIRLLPGEPTALPAAPAVPPKNSSLAWIYLTVALGLILFLALAGVAIYRSKMSQTASLPPPSSPLPPTAVAPVVHTNTVKRVVYTQIHDFSVGPITLRKTPGSGLVYAVGTVINATDKQRFGVRIEIDMLDAQSNTLGSTSDYISDLEPRKIWSFNALLTVPKVAKVRLANIEEQ